MRCRRFFKPQPENNPEHIWESPYKEWVSCGDTIWEPGSMPDKLECGENPF
jgi:hypothetical protein